MKTQKVGYVDGYVLIVPKDKLVDYKKMAKAGGKIWMKCGALGYKECVIEDENPMKGILGFPKMAKTKPGEQVWFSYIEYASRKHRDTVNKLVMVEMEKWQAKQKNKNISFNY